jgi:hypothetical protein
MLYHSWIGGQLYCTVLPQRRSERKGTRAAFARRSSTRNAARPRPRCAAPQAAYGKPGVVSYCPHYLCFRSRLCSPLLIANWMFSCDLVRYQSVNWLDMTHSPGRLFRQIRVRHVYTRELILPLRMYMTVFETMAREDYIAVYVLNQVTHLPKEGVPCDPYPRCGLRHACAI